MVGWHDDRVYGGSYPSISEWDGPFPYPVMALFLPFLLTYVFNNYTMEGCSTYPRHGRESPVVLPTIPYVIPRLGHLLQFPV